MREILVYTDGGCRGNPGGVGAWAFLMVDRASGKSLAKAGGEKETTNNRMEMLGAIEALASLKARCSVEIRSDSRYLVDMASKWMAGWKKQGWRRGKEKEEVKNLDLVQRIDELVTQHQVKWTWVAGHSGEPGNDYVDGLANRSMDSTQRGGSPDIEERFEKSPVKLPI